MELLLSAMVGSYRIGRLKLPSCCKQLQHWRKYLRQLISGSEKTGSAGLDFLKVTHEFSEPPVH